MAVVGYARASAADQDLSIQIGQLTEAGVTKLFAEKKSGTSMAPREELAKCLNYVREGDILMVTRMDRIARSLSDFMKIITDLNERDVKFKCLLQPEIDTSNETATGRLITAIVAAVAQFETEIRRDRQREGIDKAKAKGTYIKKARHQGKLSAASRLLNEGRTFGQVSKSVGIPESTLRRRFPTIKPERPGGRNDGRGTGPALHRPTSPSAAGAVDGHPTPESQGPKPSLFGKLLGR